MVSVVLHPKTKNQLTAFKTKLPHAVLLSGEIGVGLATIAKQLAGTELAALIEPMDSKEQINHETGTISVATIRRLYEQTRTKSKGRRIFIIDDADRMSLGAQAAFLKLLEEPAENIHFILTSHMPRVLLPTIRSRVQTVTAMPISASQAESFLDGLGTIDAKTRIQLEYLAAGLPAELTRLTSDDAYFRERAEIMTDTRTFLTGSAYQKLLIIHVYHQNRAKTLQLLDSALVITKRSLDAKPQMNLIEQLDRLLSTRQKIEANCNARLQLMAFVL